MKRLYVFCFALILSLTVSAEEYLNETFSTWLPDGWSVIEGPGSQYYSHWFHRDSKYATVYVTGDNQDEWLITPEVSLPSIGDIRLSADMMGSFYRMVTMDYGDLLVYVSTDSGVTWDTIWQEDNEAMVTASGVSWPWTSNSWFYPSISLNDYAGQTIKVAFRYISPDNDADWWNLDNVVIKSLLENEVELQKFEFPEYGLLDESITFEGTFKNYGANDVTSFEAIYTIDGVASDTCLIDNILVEHNTTYTFTHDVPYVFTTAEIFDLSLEITKVNGQDDPNPDNNVLYGDISIANGVHEMKPFFEVFTSSTCGTCPWANEDIDEVLANNPGEYSLVKYQMYWPGVGDPYYIVDDSVRGVYYGVGGIPDLYTNGFFDDPFGFTQSVFNSAAEQDAYAEIEMYYAFNGTNVTVDLSITPTINIQDASIHIAIVEKTTYNNIGTNGETQFHNVLMKMLPGPEGTEAVLEPDVEITLTEAASLEDTFIEEFDDLMVVAWIQDNQTKFVLQSESSDMLVGIDKPNTKSERIFPNPFNNRIIIESTKVGRVEIFNSVGKLFLLENIREGSNSIETSGFPAGIYIIRQTFNDGSMSQHKMLKR